MSQERVTLFTCDRCKIKEPDHEDQLPLNWGTLRFSWGSLVENRDLCFECAKALKMAVHAVMNQQR